MIPEALFLSERRRGTGFKTSLYGSNSLCISHTHRLMFVKLSFVNCKVSFVTFQGQIREWGIKLFLYYYVLLCRKCHIFTGFQQLRL